MNVLHFYLVVGQEDVQIKTIVLAVNLQIN